MQKAIVCTVLWLVAAYPGAAAERNTMHITCETVRAYVAQVGLKEARAVALAHGMTAWQERLARRCLEE